MTAFFAVKYAAAVTLISAAIFQIGWGRDISNTFQTESVETPMSGGSPFLSSIDTPESNVIPKYHRVPRASSRSCSAPPQPVNGEWKLRDDFCEEGSPDCKVSEGTELGLGYQLVYACSTGYKIEGDNVVYCKRNGSWSTIPSCIDVSCHALDSVSRIAFCSRLGVSVSCDSVVLPETLAEVSCLPGYTEDASSLKLRRNILSCKQSGKWEPEPIKCVPVCGIATPRQQPLVVGGMLATVVDFPWHASLYMKKSRNDDKKDYLCGATLIQNNLVLTAAHCVFDESKQSAVDPRRLFVMTGNLFREYDSPSHNPAIVRKATVETVYIHERFIGIAGNYGSDIALLELEQPFVLSAILLPACLENSGYIVAPILEPGVLGKVAGFGRTDTAAISATLQTLTVPYVAYSECLNSVRSYEKPFITKDKFCAGSQNGSTVCDGDSGSGLVLKKNDQWYVMGIVSVGLGIDHENGENSCAKHSYTLYTRVSDYMDWILNVVSDVEKRKSQLPRRPNFSPTQTTTPAPTPTGMPTVGTSNINAMEFSCTAPPQPKNGNFRRYHCPKNTNCEILQGTLLRPGSQLVYGCDVGYKLSGDTNVFCSENGNWSDTPSCVEIKCRPLNSASTFASCFRFDMMVNCENPVLPETRAEVFCFPGYKKDVTFIATRREMLTCTENGKWDPDPIKCVPVCGVTVTHQTPNAIGGKPAAIGDFPWHATLYIQRNSSKGPWKEFICGATIIHRNFLLTAAHCVYDPIFKKTVDPEKLFVVTGNVFRNYDYPGHNAEIVRKAEVKYVYKHLNYYDVLGNYVSDIALLELKQPFEFSRILSPACLDVEGYNEQILEAGSFGRVAGFGRTAAAPSSGYLQTLTVPYVTHKQCTSTKEAQDNDFYISMDKFCAGYLNGTAVCNGDSGGGLVFQRNNLWYVMGIVSVSLGANHTNSETTCNRYSYALYTKVSSYMDWIYDIISNPERYRSFFDSPPAVLGQNLWRQYGV